jgi:hypothetical protein
MSYFKMYEDPMYDEDGQLCDEDFDWQDQEDLDEDDMNDIADSYSPYVTVNS